MRPLPLLLLLSLAVASPADSFCGFYVARGDARLWNRASQVVLVRDGDRTVLTMASDYRGEARDFALVVPVPTVLERGQIHVADPMVIARLAQFSEPRLVEYFDDDPCAMREMDALKSRALGAALPSSASQERRNDQGVRIEARYAVGEYEILILSATQSHGLERWLRANGYRIPAGAAPVLGAYLRQGMKFFVAKVNLKEHARLGATPLRPIQIAYENAKFMLPIRLGMVNADGAQDLLVYAITRSGRVETTNYRNARLTTDQDVPAFVSTDVPGLLRDAFTWQQRREGAGVVFTEYAWDMSWCDPCAGTPLTADELRQAGVWWADPAQGATPVFLTRLHARYDRASFPEDLALQVTGDRENFQVRYVIRHEWKGDATCEPARAYRRALPGRREKTARSLAALTGRSLAGIRDAMGLAANWSHPGDPRPEADRAWWQKLGGR